VIACLGVDAWDALAAVLAPQAAPPWSAQRVTREPLHAGKWELFALAHPSRTPGGSAAVAADWEAVARSFPYQSGSTRG
jgi:hypothetical protein